MRSRRSAFGACFIMAALLAGCSGGGSTPPVVHTPSNPQSQTGSVAVSIVVPAASAQNAVRKGSRKSNYMSASSQGLGISVVAHGGTFPAMVTPQAAYDISASSSYCTAGSGGSRTCTFFIPAPAGSDDFQVSAWDATAVAGSFVGARLLGQSVSTQTVSATTVNNLSFTLHGTVASIFLRLSTNTMVAGQTNTATLNAEALDADGNIITGSDPFIDSNGNSLTFTIHATVLPQGSAGTVTMTSANQLTPSTTAVVTNPSNSTISLAYNGALLSSTGFAATPSRPLLGTNTGATLTFTVSNMNLNLPPNPVVTTYAVPAGSNPSGIAANGVDGSLYFAESGANTIGNATTGGALASFGTTSEPPVNITYAFDGDMYFTESDQLGRIDPYNHVIQESGRFIGGTPGAIASGPHPDGNVWFTDVTNNTIDSYNFISYSFTTNPAGGAPGGLVVGPDGNIWYTLTDSAQVAMIPAAGGVPVMYPLTAPGSSIAVGADGNLWVTEPSADKVAQVATSGTVTEFGGIAAGSNPTAIVGAIDGALWFLEPGTAKIGRITTTNEVVSEFPTGLSPSAQLTGLTSGADGSLWFTAPGANLVGKVQP